MVNAGATTRVGATPGATRRSITQITVACWARAVSSTQWEGFIREYAQGATATAAAVEDEITAALLSLFDQDTPSPTLLSYLHQAVAHPKPLLRTGHLARVTCTSSLPLPHLNAVLGVLNASLRVQRTNGSGIADVFEAKGAEEVLNGMELLCGFVLRGAGRETRRFLADLIEHPPIPSARREAGDEHSARLQEVIETVLGKQVELGLEEALVSSLRGLARTLSGQSGSMLRQQVKVEVGEVTWVESDTWLAVYEMIRPHRILDSSPVPGASQAQLQLASFLYSRASEDTVDISAQPFEGACITALFELLLASVILASAGTIKDAVFCSVRIPELLRDLKSDDEFMGQLSPGGLNDALLLALRRVVVHSVATTSVVAVRSLLIGLVLHSLLSTSDALSLDPSLDPGLLTPIEEDDMGSAFLLNQEDMWDRLATLGIGQGTREVVASLFTVLQTFIATDDLSPLAPLLTRLSLSSSSDILDVLFIFHEPREILAIMTSWLERFNCGGEGDMDEGHPIERYGIVVLFLQTVLARYGLYQDLSHHIGVSTGFFTHWLPSSSAVYPLSGIDQAGTLALQGWIGGLFGEGISDELIQSTDPRVLLRVAPTIMKQSFEACIAGVIDMPTLREGVTYFLQDLLSFTLPGILRWIVGEIGRSEEGHGQTVLVELLQIFIYSESLPSMVLELVRPDLKQLLNAVETTSPSLMDVEKLRALVSSSTIPAHLGALADVSASRALAAAVNIDTSTVAASPPSFAISLSNSSDPVSTINRLLSLAISPSLDAQASYLKSRRAKRLATFLLVSNTSSFRRSPCTNLVTIVTSYLPAVFVSLSNAGALVPSGLAGTLDVLASILASSLTLVGFQYERYRYGKAGRVQMLRKEVERCLGKYEGENPSGTGTVRLFGELRRMSGSIV